MNIDTKELVAKLEQDHADWKAENPDYPYPNDVFMANMALVRKFEAMAKSKGFK
jgi:hypothetical protein